MRAAGFKERITQLNLFQNNSEGLMNASNSGFYNSKGAQKFGSNSSSFCLQAVN